MTAHLHPGSRHPIPIRRPHFAFDDPTIPRHWVGDNAIATHAFNGLNLLFPDGERFFIQAVKDQLEHVDDPELLRQAREFAGQEAMHAREHERYFALLDAQGYRVEGFLTAFRRFSKRMTRWLPASLRVATTAGAEHWTATFGHLALTVPIMREDMHPVLEQLIVWHATEEIEHKAVAYDVMQAAGVGYWTRITGYLLATAVLFAWSGFGTRMLLRQDGLTRAEIKRQRLALAARDGEEVPRQIKRAFLDYFRRDFHPNQQDDLAEAHAALREIGLDPVTS